MRTEVDAPCPADPITAPTTLTSAIGRIAAGGTIYLRGGTYAFASTVTIPPGDNGTAGALKTLSAYQGEKPVLNFAAQAEDPANRGLAVNGNFWRVYGVTVERAGDNGIFVGGSNNVLERTVTRYNRDTGLQLSRILSTTPKAQWPADNLVLSAESHDNADPDGEDADGFAAKPTVGSGNVFRYAVAHHNNSNPGSMTISGNLSIDNAERNVNFDAGSSVFRGNTSCRSSSGTNDRVIGNADATNQFWSGTNGSRCAAFTGALAWSFTGDGRLAVTLGGRPVSL